jgi:hypothetical protein
MAFFINLSVEFRRLDSWAKAWGEEKTNLTEEERQNDH